MPSRERWIVYPILFLALGLAMRPQLDLQEIRCRRLECGNLVANNGVVAQLTAASGRMDSLNVAEIRAVGIHTPDLHAVRVQSQQQITRDLQIAGTGNEVQLEIGATSSGGRIDLTRYRADVIQDVVPSYVRDSRGVNVQLGEIRYRKPPKPKPPVKPAERAPDAAAQPKTQR